MDIPKIHNYGGWRFDFVNYKSSLKVAHMHASLEHRYDIAYLIRF